MKKFFKSTLSIAASAVIVFSAITYPFGTASATPWELERYELQNMPYLNPDDEPATCDANAPGGGSSGGIGGPLVGSTNLEKVYNYFLRQGVSKNTAAAITGSIWQESKGDPLLIQGGGRTSNPANVGLYKDGSRFENKPGQRSVGKAWGLIQWDPGNAALYWQKQSGVEGNIALLETQLEITWWHLNNLAPTSRRGVKEKMEAASSVEQAVAIMSKDFFGCGKCMNENRITAAKRALEFPIYETSDLNLPDNMIDMMDEGQSVVQGAQNCEDILSGDSIPGDPLGDPMDIGGHTYVIPLKDYKLTNHDRTCLPTGSSSRRCHWDNTPAYDLIVPAGRQILAITDGEILSNKKYNVGTASKDAYCRSVQFKGNDGWVYWYGHVYVAHDAGAKFKAGQQMGTVGSKNCGLGGAAHLHIDRGSPKGSTGGSKSPGRRDAGFIKLFQSL